MESFSADWLALREPADHAARAHTVTDGVAAYLTTAAAGARALDLAAGSGSNVRYLLPRLPGVAHWTLLDHDAALLARAWRLLTPICLPAGRSFDVRQGDLNDLAALPVDGCVLVTASALLDLVSEAWLRGFARRCREARVAVLCALSYDGRIDCAPAHRDDELVRRLVNQHQRTDKGFGPALGPEAAAIAEACFRAEGFDVRTGTSDWVLDDAHGELQRQLVEGWAGAAAAIAPADAAAIHAWKAHRLDAVEAGTARVRVGHVDLAATPR